MRRAACLRQMSAELAPLELVQTECMLIMMQDSCQEPKVGTRQIHQRCCCGTCQSMSSDRLGLLLHSASPASFIKKFGYQACSLVIIGLALTSEHACRSEQ